MPKYLETLQELSQRAGEITLKYFQTNLEIIQKNDLSPVTIADRETEQFLRTEIERRFPGDTILGEEYGTSGTGGRKWIIDPIDGTKTFVHGVPLYGVLIGIEEDGEIVAGAINIPPSRDMVIAERGAGCWWNGRRAKVSETSTVDESLLLTTDHASHAKYGVQNQWNKLHSQARLVRTWGDCYGHLLVATGRADIMVDPRAEAWDAAPLKIAMEEAGGHFFDYTGKATIYGGCGISTNALLRDEVLRIIS